MKKTYKNKKILITGGTSFLSQHLTKHFLDNGCEYIRLTSRDEVKQAKMKESFGYDNRLNFILSDVRDEKSTNMSMRDIDIVIHTAALKRVDSGEYNVLEFMKTNTFGAMNIVSCAINNNVEKVVGISTDKACAPLTLYGASKFAAEKIFTHGNVYSGGNGTEFCCTRYGNIFASTGSLIHIFKKQIEEGKPLTVTHPEMTRYFMYPHEAVSLIEYALENMKGNGEIFVPKCPSFKILDMAHTTIDYAINSGYSDAYYTSINYTGLRGAEKMHESLISREEQLETIETDTNYIILPINEIHKGRWKYPHNKWEETKAYTSDTNDIWIHNEGMYKIIDKFWREKNE